jgi:hypothetical protein
MTLRLLFKKARVMVVKNEIDKELLEMIFDLKRSKLYQDRLMLKLLENFDRAVCFELIEKFLQRVSYIHARAFFQFRKD